MKFVICVLLFISGVAAANESFYCHTWNGCGTDISISQVPNHPTQASITWACGNGEALSGSVDVVPSPTDGILKTYSNSQEHFLLNLYQMQKDSAGNTIGITADGAFEDTYEQGPAGVINIEKQDFVCQ